MVRKEGVSSGEKRAYLRHGWAHTAHVTATTWMVTAVGGWACASVCVRTCVRTCVRDVFAIYDNII